MTHAPPHHARGRRKKKVEGRRPAGAPPAVRPLSAPEGRAGGSTATRRGPPRPPAPEGRRRAEGHQGRGGRARHVEPSDARQGPERRGPEAARSCRHRRARLADGLLTGNPFRADFTVFSEGKPSGFVRILVVGNGGREHALVWKIRQSPLATEVYCAPGNAGIAELADCVPIDTSNIVEVADFAQTIRADLTVVGPELPMVLGIADEFSRRGLLDLLPEPGRRGARGLQGLRPRFHGAPQDPFARLRDLRDPRGGGGLREEGALRLPAGRQGRRPRLGKGHDRRQRRRGGPCGHRRDDGGQEVRNRGRRSS